MKSEGRFATLDNFCRMYEQCRKGEKTRPTSFNVQNGSPLPESYLLDFAVTFNFYPL